MAGSPFEQEVQREHDREKWNVPESADVTLCLHSEGRERNVRQMQENGENGLRAQPSVQEGGEGNGSPGTKEQGRYASSSICF